MKLFEQLDARRAFTDEERSLLESVQRVADEVIAPNAAAYDKSSEFPQKSVEVLQELGLTRSSSPRPTAARRCPSASTSSA